MRIAADFDRYEKAMHAEHQALADQRFSTTAINREIQARMARPRREVAERLQPSISQLESSIATLGQRIREWSRMRHIMERPYHTELAELYAQKQAHVERRREIQRDKQSAYDELERAKAAIDAWYERSRRTLFGNGGKPLPRHALVGQSFGDLDSDKRDRDEAGEQILHCRTALAEVGGRIADLNQRIAEVKEDRQRLYELRRDGLHPSRLRSNIGSAEKRLAACRAQRHRLETERAEFLDQARHQAGIPKLEAEIRRIAALRAAFIDAFESDEARAERRRSHRQLWQARRPR